MCGVSAASQLPLAHTPSPRMHPTKEPHVLPRVCLLVWKFSKLAFESQTLEPWNQNRSSGEWFKLKPMREVFVHTSGDLRQRCGCLFFVQLSIHCPVHLSFLVVGSLHPFFLWLHHPMGLEPPSGAEKRREGTLAVSKTLHRKRETLPL